MRWLALHLPLLLLDETECEPAQPRALAEGGRVFACNAAAATRGVRAGLRLAGAYALAPDLQVRVRDPAREQALLRELAAWALQFSAKVCPVPPDQVLVEIGASLRLFGGPEALRGRILQGLSELGYHARAGIAPTPLAAGLLARAGSEAIVPALDVLPARIAPLPLVHLELPAETARQLHRAGIRRIGQLLELPPDALARRFGPGCTERLQRLLGRLPDPRRGIDPPQVFDQRLELPVSAVEAGALQFPLARLLRALVGFLRARDAGVRALALHLAHHEPPDTRLTLGLREPSAELQRLQRLIAERLDATRLRAPVRGLRLVARELGPVRRQGGDLFAARRGGSELDAVLDRLSARLGPGAVYRLALVADHRPERAQRPAGSDRGAQPQAPHGPPRPLWLLEPPQPAAGGLAIESGPERIESGWWDGHGARRDYYVARDAAGARYWVYRDLGEARRPAPLYIHGIFA